MLLLILGIVCCIQQVRSTINKITQTLNPTQQQYIQQLNLTYLQQYIYITAEFKYVPLSYLYNNNYQSDQNKYIIFSLNSDKSIAFLAYLRIDQTFTICEEIKLIYNLSQTKNLDLFEMPQNPLIIKGDWFTLELRNNLILRQVNVTCYQNQNKTNYFNKIYQGFNIDIQEQFEIQAGRTQDVQKIIINSQIKQYYHLFFEGSIRLQILNKNIKFTPLSISCSYYEIKYLIVQTLKFIKLSKTLINFLEYLDGLNQCNQNITNPNVKIDNQNELINPIILYQLFRLYQNSIRLSILYIFYSLIQNNSITTIKKTSEFIIFRSLNEWHHLSITYKQNQISFSLSFPQYPQENIRQIVKQVYLFSDTNQTLFFGGFIKDQKYYYSNTFGQFNQLRYYSRFGSIFPLQITCHTNFLTSFGPYSNQCLSCQTSRNRQYFIETNQCLCNIGYIEMGYSSCIDYNPERQENIIPLSIDPRYDVCNFYPIELFKIQNCLIYKKDKYEQCTHNYFQSYDSSQCLPCQINKCKVCFEYYQEDVKYTSMFNLNQQINNEQLIIGCAQCYQGYQFNFITGICEIVTQQQQQDNSCLKQQINFNGNIICYETITDDFSKGTMINNCQNYLYNCNKCIQPIQNQYYCGECEKGYYYNRQQGICLKCSSYNNLYDECYNQYNSQNDQILNQILGFTFSFSGIHPINLLQDNAIAYLYPTSCIDGYSLILNDCLMVNSTCCFQFDEQCVSCQSNQYGTRRLTVMNMACQECSYYCQYCQIRKQPINQVNPYYNSTVEYYGYQCLQKANREFLFIDNYYGHVRQCNSTIDKCQIQILQPIKQILIIFDQNQNLQKLKFF